MWNEELTEKATAMWENGASAKEISNELGCGITRNAIIGKMHRLGVERINPEPVKRIIKPLPPREQNDRSIPYKELPIPPTEDKFKEPVFGMIPLVELSANGCKFPSGEGAEIVFCGKPQVGEFPYCAAHARIVYRPVEPRRRAR
jgi:GcrA cell cycle regulator